MFACGVVTEQDKKTKEMQKKTKEMQNLDFRGKFEFCQIVDGKRGINSSRLL